MSPSKWPRSPSHGKCSKRFCGSSRNCGRSRHQRQHEAFDCHAFKRNRQEECVQMPVKIARLTPRPSFGLRELLVASHISRLASRDAAKSLLSTLVSESSGECRKMSIKLGNGLTRPVAGVKQRLRPMLTLLFGLFFLSGFSALAYQTAWQRMLGAFAGSDSVATTIIVGAFLFGLGIGSLIGASFADRLALRGA